MQNRFQFTIGFSAVIEQKKMRELNTDSTKFLLCITIGGFVGFGENLSYPPDLLKDTV